MGGKRFFAWVWRINSLIVFAAGLAAIVVLIFASVSIFKEVTRTRHVRGVVNVAEDQVEGSVASLGAFIEVEGTEVLRASLDVHQEYAQSYGSKEASSIRNYLYFDPTSQESYWLIPDYRGLIVGENEYPPPQNGEANASPQVVVYELVDSDSNQDKRLTAEDTKTIAVASPTGKNFARVLSNVEEYKGGRIVNGTHLVILYTSGAALRAAEIELPSNKLTRESILTAVPIEAPLRASSP
ncbi:hypothetical protein ACFPN2_08420 [Steroidobacter flavus]|uniref:Uncharacterized protein n=1 Tax=Steroidobacter flavus TaxID=1842136 RepID=A0ABV8SP12_9GAMM